MKKTLIFIKHEFLLLLPPTIFFLVVFHILAFARSLLFEEYSISVRTASTATISALIVGKAILITNNRSFSKWFCQNRLIYNVIWRVFIYVIIVLCIQFLEEFIPFISKYGTTTMAFEHVIAEIKWPRFWATHMVLILFLIIYSTASAVISEMGRKTFLDIFFSSKRNHSIKID